MIVALEEQMEPEKSSKGEGSSSVDAGALGKASGWPDMEDKNLGHRERRRDTSHGTLPRDFWFLSWASWGTIHLYLGWLLIPGSGPTTYSLCDPKAVCPSGGV